MSSPHIVRSKFHEIELIEYGWVEPNNGRMLNEVDLKINGKLVTDRYFSWGWNHTVMMSHYEPDSPDGRFFFVPKESGGILLDTQNDFSVIGIGSHSLTAATSIGNTYFNDRIFVVYRDEVVVKHLLTMEETIYDFGDIRVGWVRPIDEQQFELIYSDEGSWEEKKRVIRFT
jgi:hypothetical protein